MTFENIRLEIIENICSKICFKTYVRAYAVGGSPAAGSVSEPNGGR